MLASGEKEEEHLMLTDLFMEMANEVGMTITDAYLDNSCFASVCVHS